MKNIKIIDTHTCGEPTRLIYSGFPELGNISMSEKALILSSKYRKLTQPITSPPRTSAQAFGALLTKPFDKSCDIGLIFFNSETVIDMCIHGTIGAIKSLDYLGMLKSNKIKIDTTSGKVWASILPDGTIEVKSVRSFVEKYNIPVNLTKPIYGDLAYGGNWFFITDDVPDYLWEDTKLLTEYAMKIRKILLQDKNLVDIASERLFIKLIKRSSNKKTNGFVLCPGSEFDRSPCGTGFSALLACLISSNELTIHDVWRHFGPSGGVFKGKVSVINDDNSIIPIISGKAHLTGKTLLIFEEDDLTMDII